MANATAAVVTLASNVKWQPNLAGGAGGADAVFGAGNAGTAVQSRALPGDGGLGNVDLLQSLTYGNTLVLAKTYSLDSELTRLKVSNGATVIVDRTYGRTDLTNITSIVDSLNANDNQSFTYTDQSRLAGATANAANYGTLAWTYDANGNRLSETRNGTLNSYTYPATNNKLTDVKQGATTTRAFLYDAAGNVTRDTRGATAYNYAVNNAGRIRTLTIGSTLRATWTYDGFQKLRIKAATSPAATTHYIWDSFGHIIAEHNGTGGAALKQYVWLGDTPLAVFDNTTLYYVHPDHLDRPVVMTNASAMTVAWASKYDPFGNPVAVTVSPVNNQRLPGQWFQSEDGLSYNWHRTYDPTLGRYTQADPLGFVDGPGIYDYAGQSTVMVTDPSGQCPWCAAVFWGALFGGALDAGFQYLECGEIDWGRVGLSAIAGGLGAGLGGLRFLPWFDKGTEFSHFIPTRYFRPKSPFFKPWLPRGLNGPLNGSRVPPARHFRHDGYRYPIGWKGFGERLPQGFRQLDRIPDWIKGAGAGAGGYEAAQ